LALHTAALGEDEWDVPPQVLDAAKQFIVQSRAGHMMMLEEPYKFCEILKGIIVRWINE